jgi:hypothetical protein
MTKDRLMLRGVLARVRAAVPDATRDRLARVLANHFAADIVEIELDLTFGPPAGRAG